MSNERIYSLWCSRQAEKYKGFINPPVPEYGVEAYTQETINTWFNILVKEGYVS